MNLTDTQRETLVRAYYEPLGWDLDDLDDDEFRECLSAFEPVVAAVEAIVAPYAEALARVDATVDYYGPVGVNTDDLTATTPGTTREIASVKVHTPCVKPAQGQA